VIVILVFSIILLILFSIWTAGMLVSLLIDFYQHYKEKKNGKESNIEGKEKKESNVKKEYTVDDLVIKEDKDAQPIAQDVSEKVSEVEEEPKEIENVSEGPEESKPSDEVPEVQESKEKVKETSESVPEIKTKSKKSIQDIYEEETARSLTFNLRTFVLKLICHSSFCCGAICFVISVIICLFVIFLMLVVRTLPEPSPISLFIIVIVGLMSFLPCIVIPISLGITVASISDKFRWFTFKVWEFLITYGLKITIVILGLIYIPVSKQIYGSFMCNVYNCPPKFYPNANLPFVFDRRGAGLSINTPTCVPCGEVPFLANSLNTSSGFNQEIFNSYCFNRYSWRLFSDTLVTCSPTYIGVFFFTSFIFALVFIIGFPLVMCLTIRKATTEIQKVDVKYLMEENEIYQKEEKIKSDEKKRKLVEKSENYPILKKYLVPILVKLKILPSPEEAPKVEVEKDISIPTEDIKGSETKEESMMSPRSNPLMSPREVPITDGLVKNETSVDKKTEKKLKRIKDESEWRFKLTVSALPISGLFDYLKYNYRYFQVFKTIEKVLMVALLTLPLPLWFFFRLIALAVAVIYYLFMFVFTLVLRPYLSLVQTICELIFTGLLIVNTILMTITSALSPTSVFFTVLQYFIYAVQVPIILLTLVLVIYQMIGSFKYSKLVKTLEKRISERDSELIQQKKLERQIRSKYIKKHTISLLVNFLLVVGFLCVLFGSLAVSFTLGESSIGESEKEFLGVNDLDFFGGGLDADKYFKRHFQTCADATKNEYLGYGNWEKFSSNCCCGTKNITTTFSSFLIPDLYPKTEFWMCKNGYTKTRYRSDSAIQNVRDFCSKDFKISYNETCVYLNFAYTSPRLDPQPDGNTRQIQFVKKGFIDSFVNLW
jgi:hypothetical protein